MSSDQSAGAGTRASTLESSRATSQTSKLFLLVATGIVLVNGAFVVDIGDLWSRVVVAIATLGFVGFVALDSPRRRLLAPQLRSIPIGLLVGTLSYIASWVVSRFDFVAQETLRVYAWPAGHSLAVIVVSVVIAVLGEEVFWRGAILSLLAKRFRPEIAVFLACAFFAAAHLASGTWLIPLASFGVVLSWNVLFLYTRNLTAPFVCHLLFDLLVLQIAPLA